MSNPTGQIWPLLVAFPAFVLLDIAISFGISRLTNVEFTGDLPPGTIPGKMGRRIHEAWCNYTNRPFQPE